MTDQKEARDESSCCSMLGYRVEARMGLPGAITTIGEQHFSNEWKRVAVVKHSPGVPSSAIYGDRLALAGCMSYHQAMALAWWFMAECEARAEYGMDVRVTAHNVDVSWRCSDVVGSEEIPSTTDMITEGRDA
jgi:hypothetical protein